MDPSRTTPEAVAYFCEGGAGFEPSEHAAAELQSALVEYIKATNSHDFTRVRRLLHAAAVFRFSDAECLNQEDIRSYFERSWSVVQNERYEASNVVWRLPTPTTGIASYTFTWSGLVDGHSQTGSGRVTNVFVRGERGVWLLALEHSGPQLL